MDLFDKMQNINKFYRINKKTHSIDEKKEFSKVRSTLAKYNLPTRCFDDNLVNLIINEDYDKSSINGSNPYIAGFYYYKTNTLNMPSNNDDLIHELFHIASNDFEKKDNLLGCEIKSTHGKFGTSLNEGIVDYFTLLTSDSYKSKYAVESFFASYISKIYGMDIFKEFFNGNAIDFYSSFKQDEVFIRNIVSLLDKYHSKIQSFYNNGKITIEISDSVSDAFIDCVCEFIKLLELKKEDESEFLNSLSSLLSVEDNNYINLINGLFSFSEYKSREKIISVIKEEVDMEGFNL